ncbi:MAG TPA: hypothetical protein VFS39_05155 [Nitrospira sp.]|nr:hypothetical protein [Nitrospira sp.]
MSSSRKKVMVLAVLMTAWVGLVWWHWFSVEEPVRVPLVNVSSKTATATRTASADPVRVQLELLSSSKAQREMNFTTPRNIFALPSAAEVDMADVENSAPSQQEQSVLADLAQFHYLGFVRTADEADSRKDLAVLTKNDDLHVVRRGETIDQRVVVKAITEDSVTLQDRDSRLEHTVVLSEEAVAQP